MSLFSSPDLQLWYDGDEMTPFVQTINGINVKQAMTDGMSFGEIWNAMIPTGTLSMDDIVIGGLYDDDAAGPQAKWDVATLVLTPNDAPHILVIQLGGVGSPGKSYTIPVQPSAFNLKFERNKVHEYSATLAKGRGNITKT